MLLNAIDIGFAPPNDFNVITEVPLGGDPIKYEMDKHSGALVVDRFLYTPMVYPGNYGFVPHTLSEDGDPVDVLICNMRPVVPGSIMNCRPIGVLIMEDDSGIDEKILAVPSSRITPRFDKVREIEDLPEIVSMQIEFFFEHYKDLEPGKWVNVKEWGDAAVARKILVESIERAQAADSAAQALKPQLQRDEADSPLGHLV